MPKCEVLKGPVFIDAKPVYEGEVELDDDDAKELAKLGVVKLLDKPPATKTSTSRKTETDA
jgi:hypothetical protein